MKKVIIDFQILKSDDPRSILIADNSMWQHIENKPSIIEITPPGSTKKITHYYQKNQINSFNSVNLLLNCGTPCGCDGTDYNFLPDGVYEITVKGSPDTHFITKKHLQTAKIRLELDRLYFNMHLICDRINQSQKDHIEQIDFLLKAAEANVRLDNVSSAQELLFKAQDMMEECKPCTR